MTGIGPRVWTDGDRPISCDDEDLLDYGAYADALAALIEDDKTDKPLTIAIHAPWGTGKSSLANLLVERLAPSDRLDHENHIICRFNAWEHDDGESLVQAFIRHVSRSADEHRASSRRVLTPLPLAALDKTARRIRFRRMSCASLVGALAGFGVTYSVAGGWWQSQTEGIVASDAATQLGATLVTAALPAGVRTLLGRGPLGSAAIGTFVKDPEADVQQASLDHVKGTMKRLIAAATQRSSLFGDRLGRLVGHVRPREDRLFVVIVDDLERCRPPHAVDILESLNLFQGCKNVVVVLLADMSTLAANVEVKYQAVARQDLARTGSAHEKTIGVARHQGDGIGENRAWTEERTQLSGTFGYRYIQKMVQLQFNIPPLGRQQMDELVRHKGRAEDA